MKRFAIVLALLAMLSPGILLADPDLLTNMPSGCSGSGSSCGCPDVDDSTKDDGSGGDEADTEGDSTGSDGGDSSGSGDGDADSGNQGDSEEDECIKVHLGLGRTTPWTGLLGCSLKIFADDDAPEIFTLESLHAVVGGYTFKRLGQKNLADGVTPAEVVFSHPKGESVTFVFPEGESWGIPKPGVHRDMDERVLMVDAEGWAVTNAPVYYDLYVGDGTRRRFLATDATGRRGALVSITDARGVTNTPEQMGVDIVYDLAGVRQFLTPSRLADVSHLSDWSGYDVTVYAIGDIPAKDPSTGLYALPSAPPVKRLSLRRENGGKRAVVTVRRGSSDPLVSAYEYVMGDWSLMRPSGVREEKERMVADSRAAQTVKVVRDADGTMLSRRESNYKWMSWGFAMTNRVDGFGGVADTTSWTYYTGGNGKGQVKTEKRQSGLLIEYAYDAENRPVSERRSGPDMMTETTTYAYESVDPADIVPPVDTRPRIVVKTLDGIECQRTYYVYSPLTNVVERVGEQGASYGGTNVLRTVKAFYPVVDGDIRSGFVKSIRHENGKMDIYDYVLASNLWTRTVTHVHELSPEPVGGKTRRTVTVKNGRGEKIEKRTEAFIEGEWHVVSRIRRSFNAEGKVVHRENLAGQVTTTAWDCCHKVSETQPDGSVTTWDYDVDGREIASSKLIPLDMTNVTWLATCREYDGLGRQTAAWQTNYAARAGIPPHRIRHDALGRVSATIDELGNETTTSYDQSGRVSSTVNPNGATRTTTRGADGRIVSVTGTAVTPEFHADGVQTDGTRWARTVQGETAQSPRFTTRYENVLGQIVREERSGFRSAVLATMHEYDTYGRLVRTVSDGEPAVEFTYDELGNLASMTRSVNAGTEGNSAPAAEWRRTMSETSYIVDGGNVWIATTNVNSCSGSSIAPLVTAVESQLTGLSAALPECSRTVDVRGNVTVNTHSVAVPDVVAIQTVPYATNSSLSLLRYGVELRNVSISCVTNTFAYDALGRKAAKTDGRGNTTRTEYNALGQTSATIDALGNRTEYAYDQFGNLSSVSDPLGNAKVYEYDLRGRKSYEGGATYPVRYTYDVFGNKTSMMTYRDESLGPDSGDVTAWLYDEASGTMTNKIYADGKGPAYDYTPSGRLSCRTWARGIVTDYAYDAWGNLTNTVYSDDTPAVLLGYDVMGRQIEAHDAAGTTTFAYDCFGAITNETIISISETNTIERYWDGYGRSLGYALNGERQTTIGYDSTTGRIATMLAAGTDVPFVWSYHPGSDLKSSLAYPNGLTASWQYDANNQLLQVCNTTPTNVVSQYDYTYDASRRRVSCAQSGSAFAQDDVISYGYNIRSELTNAVAAVDADCRYSYQYDDIGNRLWSLENTNRTVYVANCLNQYTATSNFIGAASIPEVSSPQYDDDGNQTLITTETGIWSVIYNGENRPVIWSNGGRNIFMLYDRRGRRIIKNDKYYTYDSYLQISDRNDGYCFWDPTEENNTKLLLLFDTCEPLWHFHDGNKNVSDVLDARNELQHRNFTPFGKALFKTNDHSFVSPFGFSSEVIDSETGLIYYNFRHSDPNYGKWMSRDFSESDKMEYILLGNSPVNFIDRLGLAFIWREHPIGTPPPGGWIGPDWYGQTEVVSTPSLDDLFEQECGPCKIAYVGVMQDLEANVYYRTNNENVRQDELDHKGCLEALWQRYAMIYSKTTHFCESRQEAENRLRKQKDELKLAIIWCNICNYNYDKPGGPHGH